MCTQAHTPCVPHMYHMRTNAYANTHTSYVSCAHKCIRKYTYLICIMCAQMHMQIHIPHMYHVHTNAYANTHTSYVQCIQYTNTHTSYVQYIHKYTYLICTMHQTGDISHAIRAVLRGEQAHPTLRRILSRLWQRQNRYNENTKY